MLDLNKPLPDAPHFLRDDRVGQNMFFPEDTCAYNRMRLEEKVDELQNGEFGVARIGLDWRHRLGVAKVYVAFDDHRLITRTVSDTMLFPVFPALWSAICSCIRQWREEKSHGYTSDLV